MSEFDPQAGIVSEEPAPVCTPAGMVYPDGEAYTGDASHPWVPPVVTITW